MPERRRWDRADTLTLIAILVVMTAQTIIALQMPVAAGRFKDDGIYLATARAIADGDGYRHPHLPGEPWQTKYPPLYPILLAGIWRIWPQFPDNLAAMQVFNALCGAAAAWVGYRLVRRAWGVSGLIAGCGALLVVVNPWWQTLTRLTMAEHLYTLLAMASLWVLVVRDQRMRDGLTKHSWPLAATAALLAGGAYLARSFGLVVIGAVWFAVLARRQRRDLVLVAAISALSVGGWQLWRASAERANADIATAAALRYDLEYGAWLSSDVSTITQVFGHNAADLALVAPTVLIQPQPMWMIRQVSALAEREFAAAIPLIVMLLIGLILLIVGLARTWRAGWRTTHAFAGASLLLMCLWPFPLERFVVPLLPLLAPAMLVGVATIVGLAMRVVRRRPASREETPGPADSVPSIVPPQFAMSGGVRGVLLLVVLGWLSWLGYIDSIAARAVAADRKDHSAERLANWVDGNLPKDAVLAADNGTYIYLRTGRKVVPPTQVVDSVEVLYPPDRKALSFGRLPTRRGMQAMRKVYARRLTYYEQARVTHVVLSDPEQRDKQIGVYSRVIRQNPQRFRQVARFNAHYVFELR